MGRIWAIARQTIAEGIRMKIALIFVGFLLLLLVGLPFSLRDEDSVSSAVQTFLSFSLGALGFVLSLLTIFLSRSLSDELVNCQILILLSKPIPRWQFVVGKWLGIVVLNGALLVLSGGGVYAATRYMASTPTKDKFDEHRLHNEVLTARHTTHCIVPDFTALSSRMYEERVEQGAYIDAVELEPDREKNRIAKQLEAEWRTVFPLDSRVFEFENIRCDRSKNETIQIRYKLEVYRYPPDEMLRSVWYIGNPDKGTPLYPVPRRDIVQRYHIISVPADAVAPDRTLTAVLVNKNPFEGEVQHGSIVTFTNNDDIEALFKVGTFGGNLARHLILLMCKLMFLAAFALLTTCVFSFPVACLVSFTFLALASMSAFLTDAIFFFDEEGVQGLFRSVVGLVYTVAFWLIPNFAQYNATSLLVDGRNVTLMWVLTGIFKLVVIGVGSVGLVACLLFERREVAEVSV